MSNHDAIPFVRDLVNELGTRCPEHFSDLFLSYLSWTWNELDRHSREEFGRRWDTWYAEASNHQEAAIAEAISDILLYNDWRAIRQLRKPQALTRH